MYLRPSFWTSNRLSGLILYVVGANPKSKSIAEALRNKHCPPPLTLVVLWPQKEWWNNSPWTEHWSSSQMMMVHAWQVSLISVIPWRWICRFHEITQQPMGGNMLARGFNVETRWQTMCSQPDASGCKAFNNSIFKLEPRLQSDNSGFYTLQTRIQESETFRREGALQPIKNCEDFLPHI